MKIARISLPAGPRFAIVDEETGNFHVLAGDPLYSGIETTGEIVRGAEANIVSPMIPRSKVVGLARTYHQAGERNFDKTEPIVFLKPNTAVIGPNVPIAEPAWAHGLSHEAELAVVISRLCKDVPVDRVEDVVFGYTVANDVSVAGFEPHDDGWQRAKAIDTSCPLGPYIVTDLDTSHLTIRLSIDGEVVQEGSTANLIHSVAELVSYASSCFTLLPGDVILTGTVAPGVVAGAGADVTAEIAEIGSLRNPIVAES